MEDTGSAEELGNSKERIFNLKFRTMLTPDTSAEYKLIGSETNALVIQVKNKHWEIFSKRMESDFYGLQEGI